MRVYSVRVAERIAIGGNPIQAIPIDLDTDGDIDLVTLNRLPGAPIASTLSILHRSTGADGNGRYSAPRNFGLGGAELTKKLVAGDLDGDPDLLQITEDALHLLENDGEGFFPVSRELLPRSAVDAAILDVDADDDPDVLLTDGRLAAILNDGRGGLGFGFAIPVSNAGGIRIADLDGDGALDLALEQVTNGLAIVLNRGDGAFVDGGAHAFGTWNGRVAPLDLDGDGDLELASLTRSFDTVGAGELRVQVLFNDRAAPSSFDVDADGIPDECAAGGLFRRGDANQDALVDLSDGIAMLSHLFLGSTPLPPPAGECGPDPTADELDCLESACG